MGDKTPEASNATVQAEEPEQATEQGQLEQPQLHNTRTTRRRRWTTEENRDVMICFYRAKAQGRFFGKRMFELWSMKYPNIKLDEKRLTAQKNTTLRKKWFTKIELEELEIKAQEIDGLQHETTGDSQQETSEDTNNVTQEQQVHINEENQQNDNAHSNTDEELNDYQIEIRRRIIEKMKHNDQPRIRLPKLKYSFKLQHITGQANKAASSIDTANITETNELLYATATVVTEEMGVVIKNRNDSRNHIPPWKRRLQNKLAVLRKDLSRLDELKEGRLKNKRVIAALFKKYQLEHRPLKQVIEECRQLIIATCKKIQRYENKIKFHQQNKRFETNQRNLYNELNNEASNANVNGNEKPAKEDIQRFWSNLWSKKKTHNSEAKWLRDIKKDQTESEQQQELIFTNERVQKTARKIKNWKAPGKDEVHGYWIKKLHGLHNRIAQQLQQVFQTDEEIPTWMTEGRTTLIMKDPKKGPIPSNYRPITCLSTLWKLMTSIISDSLYNHLEEQQILTAEQKGCSRGSRGTKDQLLIDKAIMTNAKIKHKNLEMVWVDYKKAYDSVPHSWIITSLENVNTHPTIIQFMKRAMPKWKTELHVNGESCGHCDINCGIFQGDTLSPLLFVISLIPLTTILNNTKKGYKLSNDIMLNHLLYMDDLKLYGKNDKEIESLLHTVRIFSTDINMEFGIEKCARVGLKRGKIVIKEGLKLANGKEIRNLNENEQYKYLGVLEKEDIYHQNVKSNVQSEYKRRLKLVLKSKLTGRNKISAINTYAVPVIRYTAGVINWTKEELHHLDTKTRKLLTIHRGFHPRDDVDRLYLPRTEGGRGLKSIEDTVREEEIALKEYVSNHEEIKKIVKEVIKEPEETKKEYQQRSRKERFERYQSKPLHGSYSRACIDKMDQESTWLWLNKGDIKIETEGMIIAAQDQALPTNYLKNKYKTSESPLCRLCKEKVETVDHIVAGCKVKVKLYQSEIQDKRVMDYVRRKLKLLNIVAGCKVLAGKEYMERRSQQQFTGACVKNMKYHVTQKTGGTINQRK